MFAKLDRGFRNTIDCLRTINLWQERGITVHFVDLHLNSNTAVGKMMLTILAALAEWESARKSERTREALAIKRLNRRALGGNIPIGWKIGVNNQHGKKLVMSHREMALCRLSWLLRTRHNLSIMIISDRIEAILAKREGRKPAPRCNPRVWGYHQVRSGMIRWDNFIVDRQHDPQAMFPDSFTEMRVEEAMARLGRPRSGTPGSVDRAGRS